VNKVDNRWIIAGLAAVVAVIAAFLLIGGDDDESPGERGNKRADKKTLVGEDADGIKKLASESGGEVYWAGDEGADTFEWTELGTGEIFVRYLTGDAEVGDPRAAYLTVATYPVGDGLEAIEKAAKDPGARTFEVPDGGTGLVNENAPASVYLAFEGSEYQIEVYDPDPARALELVESGQIVPVE
jgi:hypothetical protein